MIDDGIDHIVSELLGTRLMSPTVVTYRQTDPWLVTALFIWVMTEDKISFTPCRCPSTENLIHTACAQNHSILNLSHRGLTVLPASITTATCVRQLLLNNNKLLLPPVELENLQDLEELSLDNNRLTTVPTSLYTLRQLTYLNLSDNPLGAIPPAIGDLQALTQLWVSWLAFCILSNANTWICSNYVICNICYVVCWSLAYL